MMKLRWPVLLVLMAGASAASAQACSETGPDAEPRKSGCIGAACFETTPLDGSTQPPGDGSTTPTDSATGFPHPLNGTSGSATLVKGGFAGPNGPVWIGGRLIFSEGGGGKNLMHELSADESTTTVFRMNSGGANGNAVDPMGRLVTCEGIRRRIVRSNAAAGATPDQLHASFASKPFNSPNDVVVRDDGTIYFTDPDIGADPDAAGRQPKQAIFRITPANELIQEKETDTKPNGIGVSPDGSRLYVVDPAKGQVDVWTLGSDGALSNEKKFATVNAGDGLAIDDAENVYVAASDAIHVFDKAGQDLGLILVPEPPNNAAFGGSDRRTLYITAATGIYKIKLNVPGLP